MPLTDIACRTAKPGPTRKKLSDGGGLQLWVQTNGSRLWQLAYRYDGKQKQMALGPYPDVSLAEARDKRTEARRLLRDGIDPAERKKKVAEEAKPLPGDTFKDVAQEFMAKCRREQLSDGTLEKKEWLLSLAYPVLGAKRASEIKPIEVLGVLQEVENRGCYETARRLRATIGAVCRFAVATARADADPTTALRGALTTPKVTPRAAITDPKEFGGLLRAIDGFEGEPTTLYGLKLMALLFPRPGELRHAEWSEIDFKKAMWAKRIANAKLDPTFLMADVEIVATYELYNINRTKLENLIHRVFAPAQLEVEIKDRFGRPVIPREWFLVPLFVIDDAVERIKDGTITGYIYDPKAASLVRAA